MIATRPTSAASGNRFAERREIGHHTGKFLYAAGADAKRRLDLVEDHHGSDARTDCTRVLEPCNARDVMHEGLDDNRSEIARVRVYCRIERGDVIEWNRRKICTDPVGHAGRIAAPVKPAEIPRTDDVRPTGRGARNAHGCRVGLRAGAKESHAFGARDQLDESFGDLHFESMR